MWGVQDKQRTVLIGHLFFFRFFFSFSLFSWSEHTASASCIYILAIEIEWMKRFPVTNLHETTSNGSERMKKKKIEDKLWLSKVLAANEMMNGLAIYIHEGNGCFFLYLCEGQLFRIGTAFTDTLFHHTHCKSLMGHALSLIAVVHLVGRQMRMDTV